MSKPYSLHTSFSEWLVHCSCWSFATPVSSLPSEDPESFRTLAWQTILREEETDKHRGTESLRPSSVSWRLSYSSSVRRRSSLSWGTKNQPLPTLPASGWQWSWPTFSSWSTTRPISSSTAQSTPTSGRSLSTSCPAKGAKGEEETIRISSQKSIRDAFRSVRNQPGSLYHAGVKEDLTMAGEKPASADNLGAKFHEPRRRAWQAAVRNIRPTPKLELKMSKCKNPNALVMLFGCLNIVSGCIPSVSDCI